MSVSLHTPSTQQLVAQQINSLLLKMYKLATARQLVFVRLRIVSCHHSLTRLHLCVCVCVYVRACVCVQLLNLPCRENSLRQWNNSTPRTHGFGCHL